MDTKRYFFIDILESLVLLQVIKNVFIEFKKSKEGLDNFKLELKEAENNS
jgi:hypothetical protein